MSDQEYDVIVIGAEPTGENVAERARRGGHCLCPRSPTQAPHPPPQPRPLPGSGDATAAVTGTM